jgi:abortive infection bacteriophage resistance protein
LNHTNETLELKQPLTIDQQVELLKSRGMIIENEHFAKGVLSCINYYRFTAYILTHKKTDGNYKLGTTFSEVYNIYNFDYRLRNLILRLIELVEITFRTRLSYELSLSKGPLCYLDHRNFINPNYFTEFVNEFKSHKRKAKKELFIKHHDLKYNGNLPFWVAIEIFTFGTLSKFFQNLLPIHQKKLCATYYDNMSVEIMKSWLHSLTNLRNRCAHFQRLYNYQFTMFPMHSKTTKKLNLDQRSLFFTIMILKFFVQEEQTWTSWCLELESLFERFEGIEKKYIGFPLNWIDLLVAPKI